MSLIPKSCITIVAAILSLMLLVNCAATPNNDPETQAEYEKLNDPIEVANRGIFGFNQLLDKILIKPITGIYRAVAPDPLRKAFHNFLQNLKTPVILANDILQGEGERAKDTIVRFFINSTWGLLGFMDPAADMGFAQHDEDFGQTLAVWGVGEGPYLMLPIFGPSNPRDLIGKITDFFIDPINIWAANTDNKDITIIRTIANGIDTRDLYWEALEDIEKNSMDPYASIRSLYRQRRIDAIRNGDGESGTPVSALELDLELPTPYTKK